MICFLGTFSAKNIQKGRSFVTILGNYGLYLKFSRVFARTLSSLGWIFVFYWDS
jgi:hypothetical protein